jgi:hypothetical protein
VSIGVVSGRLRTRSLEGCVSTRLDLRSIGGFHSQRVSQRKRKKKKSTDAANVRLVAESVDYQECCIYATYLCVMQISSGAAVRRLGSP